MQTKHKPFVVVLSETFPRYGGPEEGGWYYDWTNVMHVSRHTSKASARRMMRKLADYEGGFSFRLNTGLAGGLLAERRDRDCGHTYIEIIRGTEKDAMRMQSTRRETYQ